jgi:hypothetical protein
MITEVLNLIQSRYQGKDSPEQVHLSHIYNFDCESCFQKVQDMEKYRDAKIHDGWLIGMDLYKRLCTLTWMVTSLSKLFTVLKDCVGRKK